MFEALRKSNNDTYFLELLLLHNCEEIEWMWIHGDRLGHRGSKHLGWEYLSGHSRFRHTASKRSFHWANAILKANGITKKTEGNHL